MKADEISIGSGLFGIGGLTYLGGKTIAKDQIKKTQIYESLQDQYPKITKFLKTKPKTQHVVLECIENYPKAMKYGGAVAMATGAAVLAYSIFANK